MQDGKRLVSHLYKILNNSVIHGSPKGEPFLLTQLQVLRIITVVNQTITKENAATAQIPCPSILTERQVEIVKLYTTGHTVKEIALLLRISPKTVEFHLAKVKQRLHIQDLPLLIHWALVTKLIESLFKTEFVKEVGEIKRAKTNQSKYHFKRPNATALRDAKYMESRASYGTRRMVPDLGI